MNEARLYTDLIVTIEVPKDVIDNFKRFKPIVRLIHTPDFKRTKLILYRVPKSVEGGFLIKIKGYLHNDSWLGLWDVELQFKDSANRVRWSSFLEKAIRFVLSKSGSLENRVSLKILGEQEIV